MTDVTAWTDAPAVRRVQRRTLIALSLAQVVGSIGVGASLSVGVLLAEEVTASPTWAGVARTASTVGAALAALPLAMLAVRAGRRTALATGWALASLGALALVGAGTWLNVPLLVLGMLLFGVGSAVGLQSRFAGTDVERPEHRSRALALVVWAGTVGSVLGPNLGRPGELLSERLGTPHLVGAFVIAAVALVAALAVVLVGLRPDPMHVAAANGVRPAAGARGWRGVPEGVRAMLDVERSRHALVALVLAHAAMVLLMTMTPVHMHDHGWTVTFVGLVISGHVLGMYAFSPLVGLLADRFGRAVSIALGGVILLASAAVAILASGSTVGISVSLFLLGVGWSCVLIPAAAEVSDGAPDGVRTLVQGASDTVMNVVAAVAAGLSGPLMAWAGFGHLAWLVGAMAFGVLWAARALHRAGEVRAEEG
ncbi:MFS transporter [Miniimonas arenae]|uniref:MFS transporter n=1 Tax=Miniimonas arenae TaxID=676201 RepID=UPI001C5653C6|nr:MFS transporter [Miniimonas arenae]